MSNNISAEGEKYLNFDIGLLENLISLMINIYLFTSDERYIEQKSEVMMIISLLIGRELDFFFFFLTKIKPVSSFLSL